MTEHGASDPLLRGFPLRFPVFQWHGDTFDVPPGGSLLAEADICRNRLFRLETAVVVQFHLELTSKDAARWAEKYADDLEQVGKERHTIVEQYGEHQDQIHPTVSSAEEGSPGGFGAYPRQGESVMRMAALTVLSLAMATGCSSPQPSILTVATLNLAHGRGLATSQVGLSREVFERNLHGVADLIRRTRPDVVALQEADAPSSWSTSFNHVAYLAEAAGFPHRHHGLHVETGIGRARLRYGTALLSRDPMQAKTSHAFKTGPLDTKGFVTASVELGGRPLVVASVHLDSRSSKRRDIQAQRLVETLATSGLPIVLCGDFNCGWGEDEALPKIAHALDLIAFQPTEPEFMTHRADEPEKRIDWILCSRQLRFRKYRVLPDQVSDHLYVVAELCWNDY